MANIKSSKKRILLSNKNNKINSKLRSKMKNQIKNCISSIKNNLKNKNILLNNTISLINKMSKKRLLHKKTAGRKISKLQKNFNIINIIK